MLRVSSVGSIQLSLMCGCIIQPLRGHMHGNESDLIALALDPEGVDTSTPNRRLIFGIFASIAEFERELIRDRVKSGIAAARSKGKKLGRPRVTVDAARIAALRESGASWRTITRQLGISAGTAKRAYYSLSKNLPR